MITNRGMSKWQPFSAIVPGSYIVNDVLKEKNRIKMPILSDDQRYSIQTRMIEAFNNQELIKIKYFRDGKLYISEAKITNIDAFEQKISLNNGISVYFSQILDFF